MDGILTSNDGGMIVQLWGIRGSKKSTVVETEWVPKRTSKPVCLEEGSIRGHKG